MKGVIVEIKNNYAVVLSDNGSIIKMKNNNYQIGEEIKMKNTSKKSKKKIYALAASAASVILLVGTGVYAYTTPYSYVSLDVNPSIEYEVNRFDRVIDATAVNDDGAAIINNLDLENKTIDEAVEETITEINEQGYFKEGETGGVVISTSCDDTVKAEELASDLQVVADDTVIDESITAEVEVLSVGKERVLEAQKLGVTPGKLNLVEKLQKSAANPEDISIEEWLNKPVKEIMKETKANKEEEKDQEKKKEKSEAATAIESVDTNSNKLENVTSNEDADKAEAEDTDSDQNKNKNSNANENKANNSNENNGNKIKESGSSAEKGNKNK
jgi:hypothetical protein